MTSHLFLGFIRTILAFLPVGFPLEHNQQQWTYSKCTFVWNIALYITLIPTVWS
jgi:hypothetical protein